MNKSNEKVIDGKRCRLFKLCVLWVCDNGWNVYRCDGDRMAGVRWKNGANGHRIIHVLGHGNVRLDYMVATCFCPPCPIDGFIYTLCHKDSDPNNCCSGNLEWRRVQPVRIR